MSAPWVPSPNPGGENRRLLRTTLQGWIEAQRIPGIERIYRTPVLSQKYEFGLTGSTQYGCVVGIEVPRVVEGRTAYAGPDNPGGKDLRSSVVLNIKHGAYGLSGDEDWERAQDDLDRIIDALKGALRGKGRDLGRPDVYTAVGEYPRESSIEDELFEPAVDVESGSREQYANINFTAIQYLETGPTSPNT